jgi:hypothetical protein
MKRFPEDTLKRKDFLFGADGMKTETRGYGQYKVNLVAAGFMPARSARWVALCGRVQPFRLFQTFHRLSLVACLSRGESRCRPRNWGDWLPRRIHIPRYAPRCDVSVPLKNRSHSQAEGRNELFER